MTLTKEMIMIERNRAGALLLLLSALCLCAFGLAACAELGKEAGQRTAFIQVLKKNILAKRGIRFPLLTEDEKTAIGPYASQYELLNALSEDEGLLLSLSDLPSLQKDLMNSTDPTEKKELIQKAEESMRSIMSRLISAYQKAKTSKDALQQPADLKEVYDEAFLKVVHRPTDLLVEIIEKSLAAAESAMALNEFILEHPDAAQYSGSTVLIRRPEAEISVHSLIRDYRQKSDQAQESIRELNSLTW